MRDNPASRPEGPLFRGPRRKYLALIFAVTGLIPFSLMLVRVRGGFAHPPLFSLFEYLFPLQFGLLAGTILAALLYLLPQSRLPSAAQSLVFATFYLLFVWGLVQRAFGIELTLGTRSRHAWPSLLGHLEYRRVLSLCEHLSKPPRYRALVTDAYISRWHYTASAKAGRRSGRRRGVVA